MFRRRLCGLLYEAFEPLPGVGFYLNLAGSRLGTFLFHEANMRDFFLSTKPLKPNGPWRVDLQLRPKELQAIGHVAAQWALLEHLILEYSKFLAGEVLKTKLPENAENDSLRQRKRAWEALARRAFSSDAQELVEVLRIVQKVGSLAIERHKIVHGLFEWDDKNRNKLRL